MTSFEERAIEIPGFTIAFKTWNSKSVKPVLCLHGKLDNAASFDLIAPLLSNLQLVAVDSPGTGLSSQYPEGVIPYWKNDALLMLHLLEALEWDQFDIIAHSLGSLLATLIALARPKQVRKLVFLDILGPTVNFIEHATTYLPKAIDTYLSHGQELTKLFPDQQSAIKNRMEMSHINYQAAEALVHRETKKCKDGWMWAFDSRLQCVGSTLPHEDELRAMFKAIKAPVCLIRAKQGVPYPRKIFQDRAQSIKYLTVHELAGNHHIHMNDPIPVAKIISQFLGD